MNTTITADDLEIDVSEMSDDGVASVMAQKEKRIAELEQEATEYLAANKKAERIIAELQAQLAQVRAGAQAHVQEWQDKANALQQERDALEKKLNFMIEAVFCDAHVFEANQMAQDKCPLCERDTALADARALYLIVKEIHFNYAPNPKDYDNETRIVSRELLYRADALLDKHGAKYAEVTK